MQERAQTAINKSEVAKKMHTQRQETANGKQQRLTSEKQSASFQVLPQQENLLTSDDKTNSFDNLHNESVTEEELLRLALDGSTTDIGNSSMAATRSRQP